MLQIPGVEICELDREGFMQRTPSYVGDILYEHLQILKQSEDANAREDTKEEAKEAEDEVDIVGEATSNNHPHHHHYQQHQEPIIKGVRKIFGIFEPLPPCPHFRQIYSVFESFEDSAA